MDNLNNYDELELDDSVKGSIAEMAKWAKFISVTSFIAVGFLVLMAIFFAGTIASSAALIPQFDKLGALAGMGAGAFITVFVLVAIVIFVIYYFIFNFSRKAKTALATEDATTLTQAFSSLQTYFIISAVFAILGVVFSLISLF
jgi:flagellar biosynthesis protein FlhB